jgi:hypothetical protein
MGVPAMPNFVQLRTVSLGISLLPATHNPLVVGSSPTGPTILKAAHCAVFAFSGRPPLIQSYGHRRDPGLVAPSL